MSPDQRFKLKLKYIFMVKKGSDIIELVQEALENEDENILLDIARSSPAFIYVAVKHKIAVIERLLGEITSLNLNLARSVSILYEQDIATKEK